MTTLKITSATPPKMPATAIRDMNQGTIFRYKGGLLMKIQGGHGVSLSDTNVVTVVLEPMSEFSQYLLGKTFTLNPASKVANEDIAVNGILDLDWRKR